MGEHTGYKAASGQVHSLVFDIKIPYSYQTMMSVQRILRILTDGRLVKKDGIWTMYLSRPFRRREVGMVKVQLILKCCDAARPNYYCEGQLFIAPLQSTRGLQRGAVIWDIHFIEIPHQSQFLSGLVNESVVEKGPSTESPSSESEKRPSDASVSKTSSKNFERNMLAYLHIKLCNSG